MNIHTKSKSMTMVVLASLLCAAQATGQNTQASRSAPIDIRFGNSRLGGIIDGEVRASTSFVPAAKMATGSVKITGRGRARLFGETAEILSATARCSVVTIDSYNSRSALVKIRAAGKTVFSGYSKQRVGKTFAKRMDLFPVSPQLIIPLFAGVSLIAKGNVGAGVSVDLTATVSATATSATGNARSYGYARASLGLGVPGLMSAGIECTGSVGDQKVSGSLSATPLTAKLRTYCHHTFQALSLRLSWFIRMYVPFPTCWEVWYKRCWRKTFSGLITKYSTASRVKRLL